MLEYANISFDNPDKSEYQLTIRDFSGKIVKSTGSIHQDEITIYRDNLVPGYYILQLSGEQLFRGRMIVQ